MKQLLLLSSLLINFIVKAQDLPSPSRPSPVQDFVTSMKWLVQGSYKQFNRNNLYTLGVGVPATWYSFNQDDYVESSVKGKTPSDLVSVVSKASVFFATPVLQIGLY